VSAYRSILVPVDGSATSKRGLREALRLARGQRARVTLLHVVDEYPAIAYPEAGYAAGPLIEMMKRDGRRILAAAAKAAHAAGVKAKSVMPEVLGGPAADEIVRQAKKARADLIVLGTHGRRGIKRLALGSDAEQVVRRSPVPVLLVRSS
jgi:nucleotide-binding universal stress UspA family protein